MAEVTLADPGDEPEIDSRSFYTVFAGSSQEEVANAKVFWSSVTLQPPLESRLVSSDIKQRLKVAPSAGVKSCKERCCHCQPSQANIMKIPALRNNVEGNFMILQDMPRPYQSPRLLQLCSINLFCRNFIEIEPHKKLTGFKELTVEVLVEYKQLLIEAHMQLKADEKERYLKKAKKRMEILELIKKQREERIQKEQLALPYKPKKIMPTLPEPACPDFSNEAQETYQALRQFD